MAEVNPTLRRRELGFLLRQLRTERGLSLEYVAQHAMMSETKLSRLETGRVGAQPRDIRDLCIVYGITDTAERDRLMALAREGKQRAWWQQYGLPYETYVGLENEAVSIRDYNMDLISGLLQVEEYARTIYATNDPPLEPAAIDKRTEARLRRQALLTEEGRSFHYIVDEVVLIRPVGGPAVMRKQLAHIAEVARLPNVTFQVIPLEVGAYPGIGSNFVILEFRKPEVNDVVYVEGTTGNMYHESIAELEIYQRLFSRMEPIALDSEESIAILKKIEKRFGKI